MNNTIEILDKDTNIKQTYVLKEKPETTEVDYLRAAFKIFKFTFKLILSVLKFSLYLVISFIELFIKVIKVLLNLTEYKPFQSLTEGRNSILNRIADKNINQYKVKFATEHLTRHTYEFDRSELYNSTYKDIQEKLKAFADNNIAINQDIYRDILRKIDIITVEVEKQALKEGYSYASFTKYRLSDEEVFDDYIQYKVMRGEGHGKAHKEQREGADWC